jgi:hypothetical protein
MQAQRFHVAAFGEVRRTLLYGYAYPRIATIGGIRTDAAISFKNNSTAAPYYVLVRLVAAGSGTI